MSGKPPATGYCAACGCHVPFDTLIAWESAELDGRSYEFFAKSAICRVCGGDVVVQPYREQNAAAFNAAVKNGLGLVPTAVVRELAVLAGSVEEAAGIAGVDCGDYELFMQGHAPSKEDSEKIMQAWQERTAWARTSRW